MAPLLTCDVSESVWRALQAESKQTGSSLSQVVDRVLSASFDLDRHSLFQVSTSNALVQGVFRAAVTVADLKRHGDFGLGTFEGLDGELVMLDGVCYRATAGGVVTSPGDDSGTPFAVVTRFRSDHDRTLDSAATMRDLTGHIDDWKPSENLFIGIRVEARFGSLVMRAACKAAPGEGLVEATSHQSEYRATDITGTLVGFWAPRYARAVSVPGYHFHFISNDRTLGGHVLDLAASDLDVAIHIDSELHIAIPETAEFLEADLSGDHEEALDRAETGRQS
jgi:acetolactate decarboxylase